MNLKALARGACVSAVMALGAASASAAVIDFTSASTGTTGSLFGGSVTWTMTSNGILNNSQKFDGLTTPTVAGLSFQRDGYGVGARDDEITTSAIAYEWIEVAFSTPVMLNAFYFLDLFVARSGLSYEYGNVTVDGTTVFTASATDAAGTGSGFAGTVIKPIMATVLRFTIGLSNDNQGSADGALAGIDVAPVPVPAAGLMLLGGLGAVAAVRRRRKAA